MDDELNSPSVRLADLTGHEIKDPATAYENATVHLGVLFGSPVGVVVVQHSAEAHEIGLWATQPKGPPNDGRSTGNPERLIGLRVMGRTTSKPAVFFAIAGILLVAAYAGVGALQILVLNPLAAAPGLTLDEIHAALAAAGESVSPISVMIFVCMGLLLAGAVGAYAIAAPNASPVLVATLLLLIVAFGAPAYFAASFSTGMSLADTFHISGGDHSRWSTLLYVTSATALGSAIVLPVVVALRSRNTTSVAHDR